jgi:DNA-directed RNA polymerase specialized sigma subunit
MTGVMKIAVLLKISCGRICRHIRDKGKISVGSQGAAKYVTEIVDIFELFLSKEPIDMNVKETTDMRNSSYKLPSFYISHS